MRELAEVAIAASNENAVQTERMLLAMLDDKPSARRRLVLLRILAGLGSAVGTALLGDAEDALVDEAIDELYAELAADGLDRDTRADLFQALRELQVQRASRFAALDAQRFELRPGEVTSAIARARAILDGTH